MCVLRIQCVSLYNAKLKDIYVVQRQTKLNGMYHHFAYILCASNYILIVTLLSMYHMYKIKYDYLQLVYSIVATSQPPLLSDTFILTI